MVRVFPIRELKPGFIGGGNHSDSQLYFHITRFVLKEEGRTLFVLPKFRPMKTHLNIKSVYTGIEYDKKLSRLLGI
jgi:hypothetical protein